MTRSKFLILFLFWIPIVCRAQVSEIQWLKNLGGSGSDYFEQVIFTSDSNYLAVGYTTSDDFDIVTITGSYDYFVAKFDTLGNTLWTKTYGGSESDKCYTVIETPEGNFLLAGDSFSNDGDVSATHALQNAWVLLINKDGEIIWSKTYGGSINDSVKGITKNSNNNYVLCGETNSNDGNVSGNHQFGTYDYWVFEITVDGTLVRQKCFGGTDDDKSSNLINGNLSDYLVIGYSASTDGDVMTYDESFHLWAINFDSLFNLNWVFGFGGASDDRGYSAVLTEDSNFILTGEVFSEELPGFIGGIRDAIIIKLDTNGNLVWVNFFGGSDGESINHISHSFGENYLLIGHATSSDGDIPSNTGLNDVFVSEISSDGIVLETIVFGGSHEDIGHGIIGSSISDFVAVGDFYSDDYDFPTNYGYKDAFILKYHECTQSFYKDTDSDGFGDVLTDSVACDIPAGYVSDSTDCNDTNPDIHPFLSDICNSIDDNCNGAADEDAIFTTYYLDDDGDLFGNELMDSISCNILIGYVDNNLDCNDENPEINPLAVEICNAIDDNCNIEIDEGLTIYTLFADTDGDTYGNPDAAVDTCLETIIGYVNNGVDCNDTIATIYPGATELCNYLDDDCDGFADENLTYILSYQDNDGDDFGNPLIDSLSCELPVGYVVDNTDCDDTNPDIFPGATEILNGLDDDCDQIADEGLTIENLNNIICSISPNPSFDIINIVSNISGNGLYEIISATGQVVLLGDWDINNTSISIINIPAGLYNLRLLFNDNIAVLSFIKIN